MYENYFALLSEKSPFQNDDLDNCDSVSRDIAYELAVWGNKRKIWIVCL